jgi:hypothetical protein
MPDLDFKKLMYATKIISAETRHYEQTLEWEAKRETLIVQLADIPTLLMAHQTRIKEPYLGNPGITLVDRIPTIRLANACEATANCLYSMAEIASNFANKVSKGSLPSSFNKLRKMCEADPSLGIAAALGDLQWYRKIRELSEDANGTAELVVRAYRRPSDKTEFQGPTFICPVKEFITWAERALATLDSFAGYLLNTFVVPTMPLDQTFLSPVYDKNGFPIIREDHTFVVETVSIRDFLRRGGITVEG